MIEFFLGIGVFVIRGLIADWIKDKIRDSKSRMAIWHHYVGSDHKEEDVRDCMEGDCATIRTDSRSQAAQNNGSNVVIA